MAMLPALLAVAGVSAQTSSQVQSNQYNAQIMTNEQKVAGEQGAAAEAQSRRMSALALGRQKAAFGAANVGYGGSSETALDQSIVNQEMDALTSRYRGRIGGYGYGEQSRLDSAAAGTYEVSGSLMAGQKLLAALSNNYSTGPQGLSSGSLG